MAYPIGSGSEILRRGAILAQAGGNTTALKWDGTSPTMGTDTYTVPTNHIITLLTIVVTANVVDIDNDPVIVAAPV